MADRMLSVREKVENCLEAIKKLENQLNAWERVFEDTALHQADLLDRDSKPLPLKGLIVGLKDIFDLAGRFPGNGAAVEPLKIPASDAAIVKQLQDAGAIILGTTKLTELCWFRPCDTRNPHNHQHTPGGSSSGSAAAVAAGMVPFAIGSQTNGSTIRPASFCGIYGFKPTFGVLNTAGMTRISRSLDHPGLLARKPEDISTVFDVLTQYRNRENFRNYDTQPENPSSLKIGVLDIWGVPSLSRDMADEFENYIQVLKDEGYHLKEISLPGWFINVKELFQSIFFPEVHSMLGYILERGEGHKIGPEIRQSIEEGAKATLHSYFEALRRRDHLVHEVDQLFGDCDIVILPSALGPAPAGLEYTGDPFMTTVTSLVGIPSASIPIGVNSDRLPLGIQAWARKYCDRTLLYALRRLPAKLVQPSLYAG
jgi:Asp-tRNA(Asn)/Glu-tRNA(Gln) amidotransferase A subunit family amidase